MKSSKKGTRCQAFLGSSLCPRRFSTSLTSLTSPASSPSSPRSSSRAEFTSIQLLHHLSHFAVPARPSMGISKLIVGAPTRCTRADRAQTVDSYLSTINAERIQICTAPAHLKNHSFQYVLVIYMYVHCSYISMHNI
jgi:hypothetical protein